MASSLKKLIILAIVTAILAMTMTASSSSSPAPPINMKVARASKILAIIGDVSYVVLSVSPGSIILRIIRKCSVEKFSTLPYIAGFLSSVLRFLYSLHRVTGSIASVIFQSFYISLFIRFSRNPRQRSSTAILALALIVAAIVIAGETIVLEMAIFLGEYELTLQ